MESQYGFDLMPLTEFESWIKNQDIARTVLFVQEHHTYTPNYSHFDGSNHFQLQRNMRTHHVDNNGWSDIGQHFTIFPDGKIATGRDMERSPACIYGNNSHSICIEAVGFFDTGKDKMDERQEKSIVRVTAALCKRFNIPVTTDRIVYHHWFDLATGARTNGSGQTKSCPGTAFFGGNKVKDCERHFLPLVSKALKKKITGKMPKALIKYGCVKANVLNIRKGPGSKYDKVGDTSLGSVVRIYEEKNRWYQISESNKEWVYSGYVQEVQRGTVNANVLNVRSGPSTKYNKVASVLKGQEVFVYDQQGDWLKISLDNQWVASKFITSE